VNYDPTTEPRGYHKYPTPTRRLRRFDHLNSTRVYGSGTRALTKCEVIVPTNVVKIKHRELRSDITTYLDVADRVGLDAANVARLYRERRDNGYLAPTDVKIETNATFRGGDH
jgi:CRP-like cAMP-binding protein